MNYARRFLSLTALALCLFAAAAWAEETASRQAALRHPALQRALQNRALRSRAELPVQRERILRFDVTAQVNADASLTVREDLEFIAAGIKIKRGIVRAIPVRYTTAEGRNVEVGLKVLSTSVDGRSLKWKESDEGRGRLIRIGDPNDILSFGVHRLSLTYVTTKQLGFFDTHDELYWNVTGNEWDMPIQSASFRLKLPGKSFGEDFSTVEWYTGRFGSKDTTGARETAERTTVTTRALQPGQGLTVVYTCPKGIVAKPAPTLGERVSDFAWRNGSAIFNWLAGLGSAAAGLLLCACGFFAARNHTGEVTAVPLFHAPDGLSPAQARFIHSGEVDSKALSAEIIRLAVQGWVKISGDKKAGYTLEKIDRDGEPAEPGQKKLLKALFAGSQMRMELQKKRYERFQDAAAAVERTVDPASIYTAHNGLLRGVFIALLAGYGLASAFAILSDAGTEFQTTGGIFGIVLSLLLMSASMVGVKDTAGGVLGLLAPLFRFLVPVLIWGLALLFDNPKSVWYAAPVFAAALIGIALKSRLRVWTEAGRAKRAQTQGLEMFIRAAEKDRLEMLNAPDDTPELFEELLPYAVATDSVKNWTARFARVLEAASYAPQWCDAPVTGLYAANDFATGMSAFEGGFSSSLSSASTPPGSSSGSSDIGGGGGSSGGGGGGGGGHGW